MKKKSGFVEVIVDFSAFIKDWGDQNMQFPRYAVPLVGDVITLKGEHVEGKGALKLKVETREFVFDSGSSFQHIRLVTSLADEGHTTAWRSFGWDEDGEEITDYVDPYVKYRTITDKFADQVVRKLSLK